MHKIILLEQGNIDAGTQCDLEVKSQGISFSTSILHLYMYMYRNQYWCTI